VKNCKALVAARGSTMTRWKSLTLTIKLTLFKDCDMIRFMIGFLVLFGVVGGVDHLPPESSYSDIIWLVVAFFAGLFLMFSGLSKMPK
jgi:Na+/H+ antiporter NhaD/arsenite permease-like protein